MKYVRDQSGRFTERPHFEPEEIDAMCDRAALEHFERLGEAPKYPISTDFLTTLIESHAASLDLYADLSEEGPNVEGVTDFVRGQRPRVRISAELASDPRREVRLRTTLAHEFGHVHLHDALFQVHIATPDLFGSPFRGSTSPEPSPPSAGEIARCKRDTLIAASRTDWMEWQAGYVCGALLMPRRAVGEIVNERKRRVNELLALELDSELGRAISDDLVAHFFVSAEAARVRLQVLGLAVLRRTSRSIFD